MKHFSILHEIRLFGLVTLLAAAVSWTGCHHASSAANGNGQGTTSAAAAEDGNPANLPPVNGAGNGASSGAASQAGAAAPSGAASRSAMAGSGAAPSKGSGYGTSYGAGGSPQGQPTYAKPAPERFTVAEGTEIPVRIDHRLDTRTARDGETFTGELYAPVQATNGAIVFKRGTPVMGEVVASKSKGRFKGAGVLGIRLEEIGSQSVRTNEYAVTAKGKGKRTAAFIGGGAGGGALIGALAGGGTGALIGALAGGGAGTAGAAFTGRRDVVIPAEAKVRFRLEAPLTTVMRD
ncbi:MAG TPA: hypothetical protein VFU68_05700 [Terracidiphilus sp.]|nr:hypothetical protein [Terracidiphilus sp.]